MSECALPFNRPFVQVETQQTINQLFNQPGTLAVFIFNTEGIPVKYMFKAETEKLLVPDSKTDNSVAVHYAAKISHILAKAKAFVHDHDPTVRNVLPSLHCAHVIVVSRYFSLYYFSRTN